MSKLKKAAPAVQDVDENDQPCDHSGQGGSYIVENGKRRLVERTKSPAEAKAEGADQSSPEE